VRAIDANHMHLPVMIRHLKLLTEKHYATLLRKMGRREEAIQLEVHMKTVQGNQENL
jgi:hypothetical protein